MHHNVLNINFLLIKYLIHKFPLFHHCVQKLLDTLVQSYIQYYILQTWNLWNKFIYNKITHSKSLHQLMFFNFFYYSLKWLVSAKQINTYSNHIYSKILFHNVTHILTQHFSRNCIHISQPFQMFISWQLLYQQFSN